MTVGDMPHGVENLFSLRVLFVEAMLGIFRKGMFPTNKIRIIPRYDTKRVQLVRVHIIAAASSPAQPVFRLVLFSYAFFFFFFHYDSGGYATWCRESVLAQTFEGFGRE